jgi:hypothetical protein
MPGAVGSSQYLRFTKETTYGVYDATQHGTANELWMRLEGDNVFTPRRVQAVKYIRGADGFNRKVIGYNPRYTIAGDYSGSLYPTQAAVLLGWALTLSSNDLGSFTIDYFDGIRPISYLGAKIGKLGVNADNSSDAAKLKLGLIAQQQAAPNVNFVAPAATAFPSENPYLFQELAGNLTINAARTNFKEIALTVDNKLAPTFNELAYISLCPFAGRDVSLEATVQYVATTDRTTFETTPPTNFAATLEFIKASPAHTLTINLESTNQLVSVSDMIPLGGVIYQKLMIDTLWDRTAANDVTFIAT